MKILHIGGYHPVTVTLAREQIALGHDVTVIGTSGSEYFFEMPFACVEVEHKAREVADERYQVIHFHLTESLCNLNSREGSAILPTLQLLRESGAALFYYSYGDDFLVRPKASAALGLSNKTLMENFAHVFIGNADNLDLVSENTSWSWLGVGIDVASIPAPPVAEPKGQLRILHVPYRVRPTETKLICEVLESMRAKGYKFELKILPPEQIVELTTLRRHLTECDLYIEQIERRSPGILALEAMAHGKTVLSGNAPEHHKTWEQLKISPVLHTTTETLARRIEGILREPRCLRDLNKRSRQYVDLFHDAKKNTGLTLRAYQNSLKSSSSSFN